ncbi:MAG: hemolysin III family protein [Lentisphaeria bacterium]
MKTDNQPMNNSGELESLYPNTGKQRQQVTNWRNEFHRTRGEEWANGISHLVGMIFGIVALVMLCVYATLHGGTLQIVSSAVFGATLILLYNNSTLYHLVKNYRLKTLFQTFDHIGIYLLIAGTYTPFALLGLRGTEGWTVFCIVWGLAVFGLLLETVFRKLRKLSLLIYLCMGWIIVFFFPTLLSNISTPALALLIAGGISYSIGVIFYAMDKVPYMHTVWHFFVLGGSVCHWVSINFFILPQ